MNLIGRFHSGDEVLNSCFMIDSCIMRTKKIGKSLVSFVTASGPGCAYLFTTSNSWHPTLMEP